MAPTFQASFRAVSFVALLLVAVTACNRSPPPAAQAPAAAAPTATTQSEWPGFVDQLIEAYFVQHPSFAAGQGRHEFDGQLPDWSAAGIQKTIDWLEQSRATTLEFTDNELSLDQRFQRDYVIARIDNDLFWLRDAKLPSTNLSYYFDYGLDPSTYVAVYMEIGRASCRERV